MGAAATTDGEIAADAMTNGGTIVEIVIDGATTDLAAVVSVADAAVAIAKMKTKTTARMVARKRIASEAAKMIPILPHRRAIGRSERLRQRKKNRMAQNQSCRKDWKNPSIRKLRQLKRKRKRR